MFIFREAARAAWMLWAALGIFLAFACAAIITAYFAPAKAEVASWYGREHHGKRTASGERFDMRAMTAAHRSYAFGTRLRVCRRGCIVVRVTDRGPFIRGRDIDLSAAAARAIGVGGVARVSVQRM